MAKSTEPVKEIKGAVANDDEIKGSYENVMGPVLSMQSHANDARSSNELTEKTPTNDAG